METFTFNHPIIQDAITDLKVLLSDSHKYIKNVKLFGSTMTMNPEEAKDVDFLIDYVDIPYEKIKEKIESHQIHRNVVVQHMEKGYVNCPDWEKEDPLRLHLLFYQKGISKLSEKAIRTEKYAIDITSQFK